MKPNRSLRALRAPLRAPRHRRLTLALALAGLAVHSLWPAGGEALAQAAPVLPQGLQVVNGTAVTNVQGGQMTVTNSAGAVLNWQSFSIGAQQGVHFQQPDAGSRVLNRVVGRDPSNILGSLTSNGEVWLVNPYGVLFGRNARVDVGSLVVSTLNIGNDDWRAGRFSLRSAPGDPDAGLLNQGEIRSSTGGRVLLLAGSGGVRNEGLIVAPDGRVVLAAGSSVELVDGTLRDVAVRIEAPQGDVRNLGRVLAGGGRIDLAEAMVNQQGLVQADALQGEGGRVVLSATRGLELGSESHTSAQGASGGAIDLEGGSGRTTLAGTVAATGERGAGSTVRVLGREVALLDGSSVDASGATAGGRVLAGGGRQGRDPDVRNAEALYMGPGATVRADAGTRGDGGTVVLWADHVTRAYGSLSARGGASGGDGGFIETSGGTLDARPASVRTDAPAGKAGLWLLDPNNILISDSVGNANVSAGPSFSSLDDDAAISTVAIADALMRGSNVSITTASSGANTQAGDITISAANLSVDLPERVSLTLNAARDINVVQSRIESTGAPLSLTLSAATNPASPVGEISIRQSQITTAGGNIALGGGTKAVGPNQSSPQASAVGRSDGSGHGISVVGSRLDAGSGAITMVGQSISNRAAATGISLRDDPAGATTVLTAGDIVLYGWVDSDADILRRGIAVDGPGTEVKATSYLSLVGVASSGALQPGSAAGAPIGVSLDAGLVQVQPAPGGGAQGMVIDGTVSDAAVAAGSAAPRLAVAQDGASARLIAGGGVGVTIIGRTVPGSSDGASVLLGGSGALADFQASGGVSISAPSDVDLAGTVRMPAGGQFRVGAGDTARLTGHVEGSPTTIDIEGGRRLTASGTLDHSGPGRVTLRAPDIEFGAGAGFALNSSGPVEVFADRLRTASASTISSDAGGDAIVLAGHDRASNVADLSDAGAPIALDAPAGRWLLYSQRDDLTALGTLDYAFRQYGTTYPAPPLATGNGVLFDFVPTLTLRNSAPIGKPYDGTSGGPTLPGSSFTVGGFDAGDGSINASATLALAYSSVDAANGVAMTVLSPILPAVLDPRSRPVYGHALTTDVRGDIGPRTVTVSGAVAADKVYDGSRAATLAGGTLANLVGGQTLGITYAGALFDTADVGVGKAVSGTATLIDGSGKSSNYVLAGSGAVLGRGDITPRPLTLDGLGAVVRPYDGTRDATLVGGTLGNLVGGQTLTVVLGAGQFDNADAGTGKVVTGTAALGDGSGKASNYVLAAGGAVQGSGTITPRVLTLDGVSVSDKVYDGTRVATVSGGVLGNVVGGQTLGLSLSGQFDTADAGAGKLVSGSATLQDGSGKAANYEVVGGGAFTGRATVSPRPVTVSGVTVADKVYDGTRAARFEGGSLDNLISGQTLTLDFVDPLFASSGLEAASRRRRRSHCATAPVAHRTTCWSRRRPWAPPASPRRRCSMRPSPPPRARAFRRRWQAR